MFGSWLNHCSAASSGTFGLSQCKFSISILLQDTKASSHPFNTIKSSFFSFSDDALRTDALHPHPFTRMFFPSCLAEKLLNMAVYIMLKHVLGDEVLHVCAPSMKLHIMIFCQIMFWSTSSHSQISWWQQLLCPNLMTLITPTFMEIGAVPCILFLIVCLLYLLVVICRHVVQMSWWVWSIEGNGFI